MQITTIGLDIAKKVFQVHGIDAVEKVVVRKQLRRSQMLAVFKGLPACLIGMEAYPVRFRREALTRPIERRPNLPLPVARRAFSRP
jgi:transposase